MRFNEPLTVYLGPDQAPMNFRDFSAPNRLPLKLKVDDDYHQSQTRIEEHISEHTKVAKPP